MTAGEWWPDGPRDAVLNAGQVGVGWLTFPDPTDRDGNISVPVVIGTDAYVDDNGLHRWRIDRMPGGEAVTSPSIHLPGQFHSPSRTRWRLVDVLPGEGGGDA